MATPLRTPPTPVTPSARRYESQQKLLTTMPTLAGPALSPAASITSAPPGYGEAAVTTDDPLAAAYKAQRFLLDQGTGHGVPFPFFAAVGGQSAGKSSVLTALLKVTAHTSPTQSSRLTRQVVLYAGSGTCTRGPTLIHSSHRADGSFSASIAIEVKRPHADGQALQNFTSTPIRDRDELAKALRWAGDQARRARDGRVTIAPYDELKSMSPAALADIHAGLPDFTDNVVKLDISGPDQVDAIIVDLPGLVGEDLYLDGLVEEYISKPECTVLLCVSAGGTDPSLANREIKLVRKHRPDGQGVNGLITKADQICLVEQDPYVQLVRGQYQAMAAFQPEHGWLPLRLRRPDEADDSDDLVLLNQRQFFARPKWAALQAELVREFGVKSTAALLETINKRAILAIRPEQNQLVRRKLAEAEAELAQLPPPIEAPAEATHEVIDQLATSLRERIVGQAIGSNPLVRPQRHLLADLASSIPEFVPFREQDVELSELYEPPRLPWATSATGEGSQAEPIYMDQLLAVLKTSMLSRCGTINGNAIRMHFRKPVSERWRLLCMAHIKTVWEEVGTQVESVLVDICTAKPDLSGRIRSILLEGQRDFIRDTESLLAELCACEAYNPSLIDIRDEWTAKLSTELHEHFQRELTKLYASDPTSAQSARNGSSPEDLEGEGESDPASKDETIKSPVLWSEDLRRITLRSMAELSLHLADAARRLGSDAGRHTQLKVLNFLDAVPCMLRAGLGLNDVGQHVTQSLKRLHEPGEEIVRKRSKLLEQQQKLADLARQIGCSDLKGMD